MSSKSDDSHPPSRASPRHVRHWVSLPPRFNPPMAWPRRPWWFRASPEELCQSSALDADALTQGVARAAGEGDRVHRAVSSGQVGDEYGGAGKLGLPCPQGGPKVLRG